MLFDISMTVLDILNRFDDYYNIILLQFNIEMNRKI